jgi:hypothetical protein
MNDEDKSTMIELRVKLRYAVEANLIVELSFGQKFKFNPRVDVRSGWTDQSFQFDSRIDVWRIMSSLFDANRMR